MTGLLWRILAAGAILFIVAGLARADSLPQADISRQIKAVVGRNGFSIFQWEVYTLGGRLFDRLRGRMPATAPDDVALVREYFSLGDSRRALQGRRERLYVEAGGTPEPGRLAAVDAEIADVERRRLASARAVERIIAGQISAVLREHDIRRQFLEVGWQSGWPPIRLALTPDVFFSFDRLPLLLVVAPRDRIEVRTSLFVQPQLGPEQLDELEGQVDRLGVSSITIPIGGFAAYPSMIPDQPGIRQNLVTIAHEWTHHYLTPRPLGIRYFTSYPLRAINETVADMAGQEIAGWVYDRYYSAGEPAPVPRSAPGAPAPRRQPDFGARMREIRAKVEEFLKGGDVAGAEAYMAQAKQQLLADGFYVRKVNTAYLSFFGAYSGGGNSFEPKLRRLRDQSGSLKAFLERVSSITSERQLDALVEAAGSDG